MRSAPSLPPFPGHLWLRVVPMGQIKLNNVLILNGIV